jgi:hypothetical protein
VGPNSQCLNDVKCTDSVWKLDRYVTIALQLPGSAGDCQQFPKLERVAHTLLQHNRVNW